MPSPPIPVPSLSTITSHQLIKPAIKKKKGENLPCIVSEVRMTPSVALSNTFAKNADIGRRERGCERFNEDKQDKQTEQTGHKTNKTHTHG